MKTGTTRLLLACALLILTAAAFHPFIECNNTWREADAVILAKYEVGTDDFSTYPSGDEAEISLFEIFFMLIIICLWGVYLVLVANTINDMP